MRASHRTPAMYLRVAIWTAGLVAALAAPAAAQISTGEIFGHASDATGAPLPGVTVVLESAALLRPMQTVTSPVGAYVFVGVPVGGYRVTFSLRNFKTYIREGVDVTAGFHAQIDAKMDVSERQEVMTVTTAPPIVDTKSAASTTSFKREVLDNIPTARDPWEILNLVPGLVMGRVNVGGSASGQQPTFAVYGQSQSQAMWNVDGATTTDMASLLSPQFYDFDSLSEIQVTAGGSDLSVQTSGLNINLVTKSGSNIFKGTARGAWTGRQLQSNNVTRELFYGGGTTLIPLAGNPLKAIYEAGAEAGGPITSDRFWWWGAASRSHINSSVAGFFKTAAEAPQCSPVPNTYEKIEATFACMHDDLTVLTNANAKLDYQLNARQKLSFLYNFDDRTRNAEAASVTRPPETVYREYSSRNPLHAGYTAHHTWAASDRLVLEQTFEYHRAGYTLDFPNPSRQAGLQPLFDASSGTWARSHDQFIARRPTWELKTDDSYFLSNRFGGDHALKFGLRFRDTPWTSFDHFGGNAIASINEIQSPTGKFAYLTRDQNVSQKFFTVSGYLQDAYSRGRWRINLGLRWDYQDDAAGASSVAANPIVPDVLQAVNFPGRDVGVHWNDVAPRMAATYDLFGTGRTVLKGTVGLYYNQGGLFSGANNPTNATEVRYPWTDLNGDQLVTRNELDLTSGVVTKNATGFDLLNPTSNIGPTDINTINPHLENGRTIESIIGLAHELMPNFGVDVQYIYRVYDHANFTRVIGSTQDMFQQVAWVPTPAQASAIPPGLPVDGWTYWQVAPGTPVLPNATNRDNAPAGVNTKYHGWQFTARKRFSRRWMTQSSFVWNDLRDYGSTSFNHVNENLTLGVNRAPERYVLKLAGMVELPGGFMLSTNTQIQEGAARTIVFRLPFLVRQQVEDPGGAGRTVDLQVEPSGATHLPTLKLMDVALDKTLPLGSSKKLVRLSIAAFNIFNVNTIQGFSSDRLDLSTFSRIGSIVPPRVIRLLVSVVF